MLAKGNTSPLVVETFPLIVFASEKSGVKNNINKEIRKYFTKRAFKMNRI
jgi:hypothetical protein